MPIFEFRCERCGVEFERLVFSSGQNSEACPDCGSLETRKVLSVFASGGGLKKSAVSCSSSSSHGGG